MPGRRRDRSRAGRLRQRGIRVSAGAWTACGDLAQEAEARLIVALGRTAGPATTRSRIRRIAREVFRERLNRGARVDLLLLARSDASDQPRRRLRAALSQLFERVLHALARREGDTKRHAGRDSEGH